MLILISPAKTLDYQSKLATTRYTQPMLLEHAQTLIREARKLSAPQIKALMGISDKLADLNATRFHDWHPDFTPEDQQAEVHRLIRLGARHVDIGQGEETWVVLADPEGNEFCVLAPE